MSICRGLCTAVNVRGIPLDNVATELEKFEKHFVFAYGTLKKGEHNHYWMNIRDNGYCKYFSKGQTVMKYPMIIASRHRIPFLLDSPGKGEHILGEVYQVDSKMLGALDELEDHPTIYVRELEAVTIIRDGKLCENLACWVYFLKRFKPKYLNRPFYKEYSSRGPLEKRLVKKEATDPGCSTSTTIVID